MTSVYLHKFPNGKVYVGIADNPEQRWNYGAGYATNPAMHADILLYGWRNIEHIIVAECDTRDEALQLEREYILLYDSENPDKGYNQTGIKSELIERVKAKRTMYEGFGEYRSAADWARIVGVHRATFGRYLQQGMTVEEIFATRCVIYRGHEAVGTYRKPRQSATMKETQETIYNLLMLSGYVLDEKLDSVEVRPTNNQRHLVAFKGRPFGVYNYKTGELRLSKGTGIPLKLPGLEDVRVVRNQLGLWEPHPATTKEVLTLQGAQTLTY